MVRNSRTTLDWESHKARILEAYLDRDESLSSTMKLMKEEHGFIASKFQYETQFKIWEVRKNQTDEEWHAIYFQTRKRKKDGKDSDWYANGRQILHKKVRKELDRRFPPAVLRRATPDHLLRHSSNLKVSTPVQSPTLALTCMASPKLPQAITRLSEGLSWVDHKFPPTTHFLRGEIAASSHRQQSDPRFTTQTDTLSPPATSQTGRGPLETPSEVAESGVLEVGPKIIRSLPWLHFRNDIVEILLAGSATTLFASDRTQISDEDDQSSFSLTPSSNTLTRFFSDPAFLKDVADRFPAQYRGETEMAFQNLRVIHPKFDRWLWNFFPCFVYLMINSLMSQDTITELVKLITTQGHSDLLMHCLQSGGWTIEVLNERLVETMVILEEPELLKRLIQVGVVNRVFWREHGARLLNIVVSKKSNSRDVAPVHDRRLRLIKLLLKAGARPSHHLTHMTLQQAVCNDDLETLELLSATGATVRPNDAFSDRFMEGLIQGVEITTGKFSEELMEDAVSGVAILECYWRHTSDEVYLALCRATSTLPNFSTLGRILQEASLGPSALQNLLTESLSESSLETALVAAIQRQMVDEVRSLLATGLYAIVSPSGGNETLLDNTIAGMDLDILCRACREDFFDLTQTLLDAGAKINDLVIAAAWSKKMNNNLWKSILGNHDDLRRFGGNALVAPAAACNFEAVRYILVQGVDVNYVSYACMLDDFPLYSSASTALQAAVGNPAIIEYLIDAGAKVNQNSGGYPIECAFEAAVLYGNLDAAKALLRAGANTRYHCGKETTVSPIQIAAKQGNGKMVELLVANGAEVNASTVHKKYPVWGKSYAREDEANLYHSALHETVRREDQFVMECLREAGASLKLCTAAGCQSSQLTLHHAILRHEAQVVRLMLKELSRIRCQGDMKLLGSSIEVAAGTGNTTKVSLLIQAGASIDFPPINWESLTALQIAAENEDHAMICCLVQGGADLNGVPARENGSPAMQVAVGESNTDFVKFLVGIGADVNGPPALLEGLTALQIAADNGDTDMIELLVEIGADVNAAPSLKLGRTALQAAVDQEFPVTVVIDRLLSMEADVNAPAGYDSGITALQAAAIRGHINIVARLLELGAHVNAPGAIHDGRTAIEGAAEHGRLDILEILLNAGATSDPDKPPFQTAVKYAEAQGHFTIARFLSEQTPPTAAQNKAPNHDPMDLDEFQAPPSTIEPWKLRREYA